MSKLTSWSPRRLRVAALLLLGSFSAAPTILAQGSVVNFETLTVNGLTVATLNGNQFLLACNPNDNSVTIINVANNTIVRRVPVGLGPVSVLWAPSSASAGSFYTANLIGDSVTRVDLAAVGSAVTARVIATVNTLDEPADLVIDPNGQLLVSIAGRSAMVRLNPQTLIPVETNFLTAPFTGTDVSPLAPNFGLPVGAADALKEPRRVLRDGTRVHFLAHKGDTGVPVVNGGTPGSGFDFDLLTWDASTDTAVPATQTSSRVVLGSANEAMVLGPDANVYCVGSLARNDVQGNAQLRGQATGFVESRLFRFNSANPTPASVLSRDLNLLASGGTVATSDSVAQPAGVAVLGGESPGSVAKVFISSFGTDRIVELTATAATPSTWPSATITLPNQSNAFGQVLSGPRDMEIVTVAGSPRLYVLNDLDTSISMFNISATLPMSTEVQRIQLQDVLEPSIQAGRRFLYDATLSGNGMVSCASCHVDGKTDGLSWHLGRIVQGDGAAIPSASVPGMPNGVLNYSLDGVKRNFLRPNPVPTALGTFVFPDDKGRMVTQTLEGLVDHPVNAEAQYLVSNAPYHWRGDRATFDAFNEAFVDLLGRAPISGSGTGLDAQGITSNEMFLFRRAVESIMYPPNPEQARDRRFTGTPSGAGDGTPLTAAGGAAVGMELFHTFRLDDSGETIPAVGNRSCVHCHALPSGSNSKITLTSPFGQSGEQPIESAQLRGLVQREGILEVDSSVAFSVARPKCAESGLSHAHPLGISQLSINGFLGLAFANILGPQAADRLQRITEFVRQFDWGIAPVVGLTQTATQAAPANLALIQLMETQAREASCGVVAYVRLGTSELGLYYDVLASTPANPIYRLLPSGSTLTRQSLLALMTSADRSCIFTAVPAGSERRIASLTGIAPPLTGSAPGNIQLEPLRPANPWRGVAALTINWQAGTGPTDFNWDGTDPMGGNAAPPFHPEAIRLLQAAALGSTVPGAPFGVTSPIHHEPPRRLRVSGDNIRVGAKLFLTYTADQFQRLSGTPAALETLVVPLFPTGDVSAANGGRPIWESTVQLSPITTFQMLFGGPYANFNLAAYVANGAGNLPVGAGFLWQTLDANWNEYRAIVVNSDGSTSAPTAITQLSVLNN